MLLVTQTRVERDSVSASSSSSSSSSQYAVAAVQTSTPVEQLAGLSVNGTHECE
jgi:hypothetical protein